MIAVNIGINIAIIVYEGNIMKIKSVALIGAGAVGSYFIWGMQELLKENFCVIAKGERAERLKAQGIIINEKKYELNVKAPEEAKNVDFIIVAAKYGGLTEAIDCIESMVTDNTLVMSVLNGVDSEELIGERIGIEHLIPAMIKIASERKENKVEFNPMTTQGVYFGEAYGGYKGSSERTKAISELFYECNINHEVCEDIITTMWYKFALNICMNLPQAVIGAPVGMYKDSEYAYHLKKCMRDEVVAVAKAKGIDISDEENIFTVSNSIKSSIFSTLQDIEAGRHTEVDMFAGALIKMGKELGVATPYNDFAYNAIKTIEEMNDGKFDY